MAYSLRLPDALDVQARQRSGQMGISLNSLICVALDAYLKPSDLVASVKPASVVVLPVAPAPVSPSASLLRPGGKHKRKGRR